jgi:hypothetical protein
MNSIKIYKHTLFALLSVLGFTSHAQNIYKKGEYGFGVGGATYFGDLNQGKTLASTRYAATAFLKHNYNPYISVKTGLTYGKLYGNDNLSKNAVNRLRNLNFTNDIWELNFQAEFNFLNYSLGDFDNRFSPYIALGLGAFNYNPYAFYKSNKYFLRPIGTEGQNFPQYAGRKYGSVALSVPIGLGIKYWVAKGVTASFEITNRFTSTDYIDDVSTTYIGAENFSSGTPPIPFDEPSFILQDRSIEKGTPIGIKDRQRGVGSTNDQFITGIFSLSIRFQEYVCPRQ